MKIKTLKKLRDVASELFTPEEMQAIDTSLASRQDIEKNFNAVIDKLDKVSSADDVREAAKELGDLGRRTRNDFVQLSESMSESYLDSVNELLKGLDGIKEAFGKYATDVSANAAPVYKDIINALSAVKTSIDDKPVPSWNWPQYAGVSVRNKNFANINPSISSFGIEDFDEVQLSDYDGSGNVGTVTYLLNGSITGVLSLTYDGSGNLTDAIRTQ